MRRLSYGKEFHAYALVWTDKLLCIRARQVPDLPRDGNYQVFESQVCNEMLCMYLRMETGGIYICHTGQH